MEEKEELVKLLDGVSMADVVESEAFSQALQGCLNVELSTLENVRKRAKQMGRTIKSNPIDKLKDDGAFNVDMFKMLFLAIVDKRCLLPATLRDYIRQVCMQAYGKALREIVEQRRKELKTEKI